ncbi:MAG TPA: hypothetical protein VFS23_00195, partial [Vicinamibacterales bacterium]|nr:hypothetical protein [Vicinamibacterales bacterium]
MNLTPERWQHIARIYDQAVEVPPADRDEFLAGVCGSDEDLRHQVDSLLRQDDRVAVVDRSIWSMVTPLLADGSDLEPGTALG